MPNLESKPRQDNNNSATAARDYLRGEAQELVRALIIQCEIGERYCELGQDDMLIYTTRHIIAGVKLLREISRRLHELKHQEGDNEEAAVQRR